MNNIKPNIFYSLIYLSGLIPSVALADDVNCTAAPDCASLGYTKTAAQCPDGGMKCPFDSSKMFCVASTTNRFIFKNSIAIGHIVYSDGTTSATYTSTKLPIGIIVYVHPNKQNNHGIVLSTNAPMPRTRAEANLFCNGYSTQGTNSGDWRLPTAGEMWILSNANVNYQYTDFNNYLSKVPEGDNLERKYSALFNVSGVNYYGSHRYVGTCNTSSCTSYYPWTSSDNVSNPTAQLLPALNNNFSYYNSNYTGRYNNFRCIAIF